MTNRNNKWNATQANHDYPAKNFKTSNYNTASNPISTDNKAVTRPKCTSTVAILVPNCLKSKTKTDYKDNSVSLTINKIKDKSTKTNINPINNTRYNMMIN